MYVLVFMLFMACCAFSIIVLNLFYIMLFMLNIFFILYAFVVLFYALFFKFTLMPFYLYNLLYTFYLHLFDFFNYLIVFLFMRFAREQKMTWRKVLGNGFTTLQQFKEPVWIWMNMWILLVVARKALFHL